jgi:hypothetical protein
MIFVPATKAISPGEAVAEGDGYAAHATEIVFSQLYGGMDKVFDMLP